MPRRAGPPAPSTPDAAGQPFGWAGVEQFAFNPEIFGPVGRPTVTGESTVGSGLLPGRAPSFTVRFPRAGAYAYVCGIHPGMKGTVTVRPRAATAPAAAIAAARAKREGAALQRQARRAAAAAAKVGSAASVSVGYGAGPVHLYRFVPARTEVATGAVVDFRMAGNREIHTVTFGQKDDLKGLAGSTFGPGVRLLDPRGTFPSDPGATAVSLTAATHGNGFVNSGILTSPPIPGPRRFSVRFDAPGTYEDICLVHPEMVGQVVVS